MVNNIIQGIAGRMGHVLCDMIAQRTDCRVLAGIDQADGAVNGIPVYDSLDKLDGQGDVLIDFSSPAAVEKALPYCQAHHLPACTLLGGPAEKGVKITERTKTTRAASLQRLARVVLCIKKGPGEQRCASSPLKRGSSLMRLRLFGQILFVNLCVFKRLNWY